MSNPRTIVGVIPARLASVRLPRKPLRLICGYPMIAWVYARARAARELSDLLVATDSDEILEWCRSLRIPAAMTSPAHRSGTERILEVVARRVKEGTGADIYVNIQGDEPMVDIEHISLLIQPFLEDSSTQVSTLKVRLEPAEAPAPDRVKVVTDSRGNALYFSRNVLPYHRDAPPDAAYFKHLGFYAYSAAALERYRTLRPGPLEAAEHLEQLRFLENGVSIAVRETTKDTLSVDSEDDLRKVEQLFREAGLTFPG